MSCGSILFRFVQSIDRLVAIVFFHISPLYMCQCIVYVDMVVLYDLETVSYW